MVAVYVPLHVACNAVAASVRFGKTAASHTYNETVFAIALLTWQFLSA
jgi:hypothetical protein